MSFKPKLAYSGVVALLGGLAWFNLSWPRDSSAAMNWLNAIDEAIFRPAAHPTMFALVVGLAIGTFLLPEIWRVVRDYAFPSDPRADWDLRDAVDYLRVRSKWAIGRIYYTDKGRLGGQASMHGCCGRLALSVQRTPDVSRRHPGKPRPIPSACPTRFRCRRDG
jgi:hypothetical protein